MIIFGMRTMVKTLAMLTFVCSRCGNPAAHRVVQRTRWFTLFFIPIFPTSVKRYSTCTFCGATTAMSKEDAERLVAAQSQGVPQVQQPQYPQQAQQQQGTDPGQQR